MDIYYKRIIQINAIRIEHQQLDCRVIWANVTVFIFGMSNPGRKYFHIQSFFCLYSYEIICLIF